jgi:hypothetical protein
MVLYEIYREDGGNRITFVHMLYRIYDKYAEIRIHIYIERENLTKMVFPINVSMVMLLTKLNSSNQIRIVESGDMDIYRLMHALFHIKTVIIQISAREL